MSESLSHEHSLRLWLAVRNIYNFFSPFRVRKRREHSPAWHAWEIFVEFSVSLRCMLEYLFCVCSKSPVRDNVRDFMSQQRARKGGQLNREKNISLTSHHTVSHRAQMVMFSALLLNMCFRWGNKVWYLQECLSRAITISATEHDYLFRWFLDLDLRSWQNVCLCVEIELEIFADWNQSIFTSFSAIFNETTLHSNPKTKYSSQRTIMVRISSTSERTYWHFARAVEGN